LYIKKFVFNNMGFDSDLLGAARSLYDFTQHVMAIQPHEDDFGELHDISVDKLCKLSAQLQSSIYGLKGHLPRELKKSVDAQNRFTSYLFNSFYVLVNYRSNYGSHNPFGISIDTSLDTPVRNRLVMDSFYMASMAILLVHHFQLEFIMYCVAVADSCFEMKLMSTEAKNKFRKIMSNLYSFMRRGEIALHRATRTGCELGVAAITHTQEGQISHFIEEESNSGKGYVLLPYTVSSHGALIFQRTRDKTKVIHTIRRFYYTCVLDSLSFYLTSNERRNASVVSVMHQDEFDTRQSALFQRQKFVKNMMHDNYMREFPNMRFYEMRNLRQQCFEDYSGYSKKPVTYYATKPSPLSGDEDHLVLQDNGPSINVAPRKRVVVYKKQARWNDDSERRFAIVHSELSIMSDLFSILCCLGAANKNYRMTESYGIEYMHFLHLSFLGFHELNLADSRSNEFKRALNHAREAVTKLTNAEPDMPHASNLAPMPQELIDWVGTMYDEFTDGDTGFRLIPTNSVVYYAKTLNLSDTVPKEKYDPEYSNVIYSRTWFPMANFTLNGALSINSITRCLLGEAIQWLTYENVAQKILAPSNNNVSDMKFSPENGDLLYGRVGYYDLCKSDMPTIRTMKEKIEADIRHCKSLKPPNSFLNPLSWLPAHIPTGWSKLHNHTYDISKGKGLNMDISFTNDDDGDDDNMPNSDVGTLLEENHDFHQGRGPDGEVDWYAVHVFDTRHIDKDTRRRARHNFYRVRKTGRSEPVGRAEGGPSDRASSGTGRGLRHSGDIAPELSGGGGGQTGRGAGSGSGATTAREREVRSDATRPAPADSARPWPPATGGGPPPRRQGPSSGSPGGNLPGAWDTSGSASASAKVVSEGDSGDSGPRPGPTIAPERATARPGPPPLDPGSTGSGAGAVSGGGGVGGGSADGGGGGAAAAAGGGGVGAAAVDVSGGSGADARDGPRPGVPK
jgi:hypothetical protein